METIFTENSKINKPHKFVIKRSIFYLQKHKA